MCKHTWNWYNNRRRSIRLPGYDYSASGLYFVTICTYQRQCLFGAVVNGEMRLNDLGQIVAAEWVRSADIRREIECDEWVVMPNHVHGIVRIVAGGLDGVAIANATNGSGGNAVDMADGVAIADAMNGSDAVMSDTVMDGSDDVTSVDLIDASDTAPSVDVMDGSDTNVTNGSDNVTFKNMMDASDTVGAPGRAPLHGYPQTDNGDRGRPPYQNGDRVRFPTGRNHRVRSSPQSGDRPTISPRSLSSFVGGFKCSATKQINIHRNARGTPVWQRNYYERIIRDTGELFRIRRYIRNNPLNWR
ncbi:MAG: hypothetical protein AAF289_13780 [Cyanobacteria bacterium P01_A01_bin.135]